MSTITHPTYTLITSPTSKALGVYDLARNLAGSNGHLCALHHTTGPEGAAGVMARTAGGVLLLENPGDFHPLTIGVITDCWVGMWPGLRPVIVVVLRGDVDNPEGQARELERFAILYRHWRVASHLVAGASEIKEAGPRL